MNVNDWTVTIPFILIFWSFPHLWTWKTIKVMVLQTKPPRRSHVACVLMMCLAPRICISLLCFVRPLNRHNLDGSIFFFRLSSPLPNVDHKSQNAQRITTRANLCLVPFPIIFPYQCRSPYFDEGQQQQSHALLLLSKFWTRSHS